MEVQKSKNFIEKSFDEKLVFDDILEYLDSNITDVLKKISKDSKENIEEIRLRIGYPLLVYANGQDYFINYNGKLKKNAENSFVVNNENIKKTFNMISNYSIYAFQEEIKKGFITIKGGHRVGVAGKVIYGVNGLETIKNISSLNIRIAREKKGISDAIMEYLISESNSIYHTLIVSPPQCGKTTLLRDLIRNISNGIPELKFKGLKVGVVDERSEIASVYNGQPQKDVGIRTDILDGCQKYDGIILLIRSMSPSIVATDELGGSRDIKAIHEALKAGVKILSTVHGEGIEDIKTKPNLKEIINERIFQRIIILDNSKGVGTISDIVDGKTLQTIFKETRSKDVIIKNIRKYNDNYIM